MINVIFSDFTKHFLPFNYLQITKIPKTFFSLSANFIIFMAFSVCFFEIPEARCQEKTPFFQKKFANDSIITVRRIEVPYKAPSEEQKKNLSLRIPGATYSTIPPDKCYEYSIYLRHDSLQKEFMVWRKVIREYTAQGQRPYKIYDVLLEKEVFVMLHRHDSYLFGEVIHMNQPQTTNYITEGFVITQEGDSAISQAYLDGIPSKDTLSATIKTTDNRGARYNFNQDHWVPQKTTERTTLCQKSVNVKEENWEINLNINPKFNQAFQNTDKSRQWSISATRISLEKIPQTAQGTLLNDKKVLLWQSLDINNPSAAPNFWSADAVVDEKTQKLYAVLANGSRFWLQVVDFSRREAPTREGDTVLLPHFEPYSIETPPDVTAKLPYIEAVQIEKVGEELQVSINKGEAPKWAYSFATRRWKEVPPETPTAK